MNRSIPLTFSGSSRLGLLLAAALAILTGILVFAILRDNANEPAALNLTEGPDRTVVVASQDIGARTVITADMLTLSQVPAGALLSGAYAEKSLAVGQVASVPILKGEQVVSQRLVDSKSPIALPYLVPKDYRAMAVKVDKVVGTGGLLRPGDRVDVIGVVEVRYEPITGAATTTEFKDTRAVVLAQNVEVLAVEQKLQNRVTGTKAATTEVRTDAPVDQPDPQPEADVVTLALTPVEAQDVMLTEVKGTIRLIVRAPGDTSVAELGDRTFFSLSDPAFQALLQEAARQAALRTNR